MTRTTKRDNTYTISITTKDLDGQKVNDHLKQMKQDNLNISSYIQSLILKDINAEENDVSGLHSDIEDMNERLNDIYALVKAGYDNSAVIMNRVSAGITIHASEEESANEDNEHIETDEEREAREMKERHKKATEGDFGVAFPFS